MKRTALITAAVALALAGVPVGASSATAATTGCTPETHTVTLPDGTSQTHTWYFCRAGAYQWVNSTGAAMTTTIWDPPVGQYDDHSLAELAVEKGRLTTTGTDDQTIEIGWRVSPKTYGDQLPHLFIYYWVNGVAHECYKGCAGAFVPQSSTVTPGMALPTGTSQTFAIDYTGGQWWLYYGGTWFGYFNSSLWNGTYTQSDLIQIFGEVASTKADPPCTNMGDGNFGSSANGALVSNVGFYGATDAPALGLGNVDNPALYDAKIMSANSFQYGGPGNTSC